ncbi:MAG: DUF4270 family protein, partial [Ginsengibacter sp.]
MPTCRSKTYLTGILLLLILSWGCTKIDTTELGQDLIPAVDNIHTFETTLDVVVNNFDSLAAACDSLTVSDLHALGIIENDPYFGKTSAAIFTEFKPTVFPYVIPSLDSLHLDSVILVLHYNHSFGDSSRPQKVQVYPLSERIKSDSTYTTCSVFGYDNFSLLGEKTFLPKDLDDSVHSFREDASGQLRINLDTAFIRNFLKDTAIFKSDSAFTAFFKGFAIVPDQSIGGDALSYFSLTDVGTRLSLYFTSTKTVKDTLVYDMPFTQSSGHANSIVRERGNSEIVNNITHKPEGDEFVYLQTSPGSFATITIPGLTGLSNRVIHRAELITEQVYSPAPSDAFFTPPRLIYLDTKDTSTNGRYIPIPCDFTIISQQPNFSELGIVKQSDDGQGHMLAKYVFNISRYIQTIVTKNSNNAVFRLRAPSDIVNPAGYIDRCNQGVAPFSFTVNSVADGRVKLHGSDNSSRRMRLHI